MQAYVDSEGTRLELEFKNFRQFVTEVGPNISTDGLFVETTAPAGVGSTLDFTLRLEDGHALIHGRGVVAWVRSAKDSPDPPPGMALRFLEVVESDADLIEQIVGAHLAEGGVRFDLKQGPPPQAGPDGPKGTPETGAGARESAPATDPPRSQPLPPTEVALNHEIPLPPAAPPTLESTLARGDPTTPSSASDLDAPSGGRPATGSAGGQWSAGGSSPGQPGARAGVAAPQGPPRDAAAANRRKTQRLRVAPSLIVLLVASGVIGALTYRLTEKPVFRLTDGRGGTEPTAFANIPPPESLSPTAGTGPMNVSQLLPRPEAPPSEARAKAGPGAAAKTDSFEGAREVEPASQAAPTSPEASPLPQEPPLTRIRFINWRRRADRRVTEVVLTGDGPIGSDRFEHGTFGQRELIRVFNVKWPYPKRLIQVDTPEVDRIRIGFHPRPAGNELHIVLDLARPEASLKEIRSEGRRLRLWIVGGN